MCDCTVGVARLLVEQNLNLLAIESSIILPTGLPRGFRNHLSAIVAASMRLIVGLDQEVVLRTHSKERPGFSALRPSCTDDWNSERARWSEKT